MSHATAIVAATRLEPSPRWTRSREDRFRHVFATCDDDSRYRDVPVDWWDATEAMWRPTAVLRATGGRRGARLSAEVIVPAPVGTDIREVPIATLRISRLLTAGVARFWTSRYRRLLALAIIERAPVSVHIGPAVHALHDALRHEELLARDVWMTAFRTGAGDGCGETCGVIGRSTSAAGTAATARNAGLTRAVDAELVATATPLLAADLLRLHAALRGAGEGDVEISAHPVVAMVSALLRSAVTTS